MSFWQKQFMKMEILKLFGYLTVGNQTRSNTEKMDGDG